MANVKISALPAATAVASSDLFPVVQGGVTKQVTPDLLPISAATAAALAGKDASGAAAAAQATAIQRANHTGTQSADTLTDGTTNKAFTATERSKLAGVAAGATANRTDAAVDTLLTGKADLVAGVIPTAQIPALALTTAVTVASQAAMLALTATQVQPGDVAVRTDGAGTFILTATDPTVLGNWTRLNAPTDAVTTVNGQSGTVVLNAANVGADAAGAAAAAVVGLAPLASPAFTGSPTIGGAAVAKTTDVTAAVAAQATADAATYQPLPVSDLTGLVNYNRLTPFGSRAGFPQGFTGGISSQASRYRIPVPFASSEIRLVYANWTGPGLAEQDGTADLVVRAGIEMGDGTFRTVYFSGQRDGKIGPGGTITSDPVAIEHAGPTDPTPFLFVRTKVIAYQPGTTTLSPGSIPQGPLPTDTNEGVDNDPTGDNTTSGSIGSTYNFMYVPALIVGDRPAGKKPIFVGVGDSITYGRGDEIDGYGWFARACVAGHIPYVKLAQGGVQAAFLSPPLGHARAFGLATGASHALVLLGANDFGTDAVAVTPGTGQFGALQAALILTWRVLATRGMKVHACTLTPRTTSTDDWATTGSQTVTPSNTGRIGINTWIRAGAPVDPATLAAVAVGTAGALVAGQPGHPLVGHVELADAVETARDSGIWRAGYAADGLHPSTPGTVALAAAVPIAAIAAS